MTLFLNDDAGVFGTLLLFKQLPPLYAEFARRYPETLELESIGAELLRGNFDESDTSAFVSKVCRWGGYAGIAARVFTRNPASRIVTAFRNAAQHLAADPPAPGLALVAVNQLHGLGTPSFASKHLRFFGQIYVRFLTAFCAMRCRTRSTPQGTKRSLPIALRWRVKRQSAVSREQIQR